MNTNQIPAFMKPEAWTQFWPNPNDIKANKNGDIMRVVQDFAQLQSQYTQNMLGQWQQLTQAVTKPEALPEECNKFIKSAAESTMEHAQSMMKMMQDKGANVLNECPPKASKASGKKA